MVMNEWHVAFIVLLGAFINKIFLAIRYFSVEHSSEDRSNIIFDIFIVVTGMGLVWTWHGKSITKEIQQSRDEQREQHTEMMGAIMEMTRAIRAMNTNASKSSNATEILSEDVAILSADVNFLSNNIENTVDELSRGVRNDIRGLTSRIR